MLRRLLATYMTFVLVAGPGLCCCTTAPASAPSLSASAPQAPPTPGPSSCGCEDGCPQKAHDPSGEPVRSEHAPKPGRHDCPCKDKGAKQALDQPAPPLTPEEVSRLLTATVLFVPVTLTADAVVDPDLDSGGSPSGHRLTSWRLLKAAHMLRC